MSTALVTGSSSGLGRAIAEALEYRGHTVIRFDRASQVIPQQDVTCPGMPGSRPPPKALDILVNCAGIAKLGWIDKIDRSDWDATFDVNCRGILKMSQWVLPILRDRRGTILNIVSSASHMPMRASLLYNASKAAAHMMTLQMARELSPDVTVFGISPARLRGTGMSDWVDDQVAFLRDWTPEEVAAKQASASLLPEGDAEIPPESVADFIAYLLATKERHKYLTGCVIPYGA